MPTDLSPTKTPASAATGAGFNIAPGAAPDDANKKNGDVWTTSAGIYVQINGATIGPLSAGAGGGEARAQTLCSVYDGTGSPTYDFYYADVAQTVSYKYLTNTSVTPAAVVMRSTAANPTSFATVVNNPANGQTGSFTMEAGASVYFMTASSGLHWLHLKRTA